MNTTEDFYMEHANITVQNIDESVKFFKTAFPNIKIRGGGDRDNDRWIHIGTDITYFALTERKQVNKADHNYDAAGINHLGFTVSNVQEIADRLLAAGYKRSYETEVHKYRIRDYFYDSNGNEFEFVEYLSDKAEERNEYSA